MDLPLQDAFINRIDQREPVSLQKLKAPAKTMGNRASIQSRKPWITRLIAHKKCKTLILEQGQTPNYHEVSHPLTMSAIQQMTQEHERIAAIIKFLE